MIISASYKTDIPAFYGEWFRNRLRAGFCRMVNAFNRHQHYTVSLRRADVDGFVFWTKNLGPFLKSLKLVEAEGYPFMVQYTINGYPRALESRVVDAARAVGHMRELVDRFGPRVGVWRYDTIIFSTITPPDYHRRNFEALARRLEGVTDEVVLSFMQLYRKTRSNLDAAAVEHGFGWEDTVDDVKLKLLKDLVEMAQACGMRLTMCGQPEYIAQGAEIARCIDADRLADIAGRGFKAKLKGGRASCGCYKSKDIGDYDTCPHGCVYCYAVRNRELAVRRYREHDPEGEYLVPTAPPQDTQNRRQAQLELFDDA